MYLCIYGASRIPPLGFPKSPTLHFSEDNLYPTASTCSLTLTIQQGMVLIMNLLREPSVLHSNSMEDLVMFDIIHSYSTAASIG